MPKYRLTLKDKDGVQVGDAWEAEAADCFLAAKTHWPNKQDKLQFHATMPVIGTREYRHDQTGEVLVVARVDGKKLRRAWRGKPAFVAEAT